MIKVVIFCYIHSGSGDFKHLCDIIAYINTRPQLSHFELSVVINSNSIHESKIEARLHELGIKKIYFETPNTKPYDNPELQLTLSEAVQTIMVSCVKFHYYPYMKYISHHTPFKSFGEHEVSLGAHSSILSKDQIVDRPLGLGRNTYGIKINKKMREPLDNPLSVLEKQGELLFTSLMSHCGTATSEEFNEKNFVVPAYFSTHNSIFFPFLQMLMSNTKLPKNRDIAIIASAPHMVIENQIKAFARALKNKDLAFTSQFGKIEFIRENEKSFTKVLNKEINRSIRIFFNFTLSDASFNAIFHCASLTAFVTGDNTFEMAVSRRGIIPFYISTNAYIKKNTLLALDKIINKLLSEGKISEKVGADLLLLCNFDELNFIRKSFDSNCSSYYMDITLPESFYAIDLTEAARAWQIVSDYIVEHHNYYDRLEEFFLEKLDPLLLLSRSEVDIGYTPSLVDVNDLSNGRLISPEIFETLRPQLKDGRNTKKSLGSLFPTGAHVYSIIKLNDQYFAIYKGKKHGKTFGGPNSDSFKLAQNIITGEWVMLHSVKSDTSAELRDEKIRSLITASQYLGFYSRQHSHPEPNHEILLRLTSGITLSQLLQTHGIVSSIDKIKIANEMFHAILNLYERGLMTDTITLDNFLINTETGAVSLADYLSISKTHENEKTLVYNIGIAWIALFELVTAANSTYKSKDKSPSPVSLDSKHKSNLRCPILYKLVEQMIQADPAKRPSLAQVGEMLNSSRVNFIQKFPKLIEVAYLMVGDYLDADEVMQRKIASALTKYEKVFLIDDFSLERPVIYANIKHQLESAGVMVNPKAIMVNFNSPTSMNEMIESKNTQLKQSGFQVIASFVATPDNFHATPPVNNPDLIKAVKTILTIMHDEQTRLSDQIPTLTSRNQSIVQSRIESLTRSSTELRDQLTQPDVSQVSLILDQLWANMVSTNPITAAIEWKLGKSAHTQTRDEIERMRNVISGAPKLT